MTAFETFLSSQSSFALAALAVSWIAFVLLALVAANLHFRLAQLEQAQPSAEQARTPFGHLVGRSLVDILGPVHVGRARLVLVLSSSCTSCDRVLEWLRQSAPAAPIALLWRDGTPSPPPSIPAGAVIVDGRPGLSSVLGVQVTPFALAADDTGRISRAVPVGNLDVLAALVDGIAQPARGDGGPTTFDATIGAVVTAFPERGL
jgi:hypothetical protein